MVNVEPPPLKFGDLFEPQVPEYFRAVSVSSSVWFATVALDTHIDFNQVRRLSELNRTYPAGASCTVALKKSKRNAPPPASVPCLPRLRSVNVCGEYVRLSALYSRYGAEALEAAYALFVVDFPSTNTSYEPYSGPEAPNT